MPATRSAAVALSTSSRAARSEVSIVSAASTRVATRVLAAEAALTSDLAARDEVESATASDRVAEIDAELREHAVATAKAAAVRDRRLPSLKEALGAVRAELYGSTAPSEGQADELAEELNR